MPGDLLHEIISTHRTDAGAKGLALHTRVADDLATEWVGPKETVRTALGLLVDNAIKFTPQGTVTLEVAAAEEGLEFVVHDTGIGLTSQQLDWIRIPFAQVDGGMNRRSTGIGIGLPLAHRLARAAGGSLHLEAGTERGLRASLTVRARPATT